MIKQSNNFLLEKNFNQNQIKLRSIKNKVNFIEIEIPNSFFNKACLVNLNYLKKKLIKEKKLNSSSEISNNFWIQFYSILMEGNAKFIKKSKTLPILRFKEEKIYEKKISPYINFEQISTYLIKDKKNMFQIIYDSNFWQKKLKSNFEILLEKSSDQTFVFFDKKEAIDYLKLILSTNIEFIEDHQLSIELNNAKNFYKLLKSNSTLLPILMNTKLNKNLIFISKNSIVDKNNDKIFLASFSEDSLKKSLKFLLKRRKRGYYKIPFNDFFKETDSHNLNKYFFIPSKKNNIRTTNKKRFLIAKKNLSSLFFKIVKGSNYSNDLKSHLIEIKDSHFASLTKKLKANLQEQELFTPKKDISISYPSISKWLDFKKFYLAQYFKLISPPITKNDEGNDLKLYSNIYALSQKQYFFSNTNDLLNRRNLHLPFKDFSKNFKFNSLKLELLNTKSHLSKLLFILREEPDTYDNKKWGVYFALIKKAANRTNRGEWKYLISPYMNLAKDKPLKTKNGLKKNLLQSFIKNYLIKIKNHKTLEFNVKDSDFIKQTYYNFLYKSFQTKSDNES